MPEIEFIYQPDCPNVGAARAVLKRALAAQGGESRWREWDSTAADSPVHARVYGSPTILVDGTDIAGAEPSDAPACRIYRDAAGRASGVPSEELVRSALRARTPDARPRVLGTFAVLPTLGVSLLPKLTCAACWPAYSAALAAAGIGFVDYTPYLGWVMAGAIAVTGLVLVRQARRQRRYAPLLLGAVGAGVLIVAKLGFDHAATTYVGAAVLAAATFWSGWTAKRAGCTACADAR